jgi:hypothetical protein
MEYDSKMLIDKSFIPNEIREQNKNYKINCMNIFSPWLEK